MEKDIKTEPRGTFGGTPDDYAVEEHVLKGHVEELECKCHIVALLLQQKQLEEDLVKLDIAAESERGGSKSRHSRHWRRSHRSSSSSSDSRTPSIE